MVDHKCTELELGDSCSFQPWVSRCARDPPHRRAGYLPVRLGGPIGFSNPTQSANAGFQASVNVIAPLAEQIMSQLHEPPDEAEITLLQQKAKKLRKGGKITQAIGRMEEFCTCKNKWSCQLS